MNQKEKNRKQRIKRKENHNAYTKHYEKTIPGFLMRMYRNMKSRTSGVQKLKAHLYLGKALLPKEDFYKWAEGDCGFMSMFNKWRESGFDRKLTPTVNRIDSSKGYELGNMEWLTHSENSRLGAKKKFVSPEGKLYGGA